MDRVEAQRRHARCRVQTLDPRAGCHADATPVVDRAQRSSLGRVRRQRIPTVPHLFRKESCLTAGPFGHHPQAACCRSSGNSPRSRFIDRPVRSSERSSASRTRRSVMRSATRARFFQAASRLRRHARSRAARSRHPLHAAKADRLGPRRVDSATSATHIRRFSQTC